ncbi:MAG: ABC transporter permease [Alkaliphilus sp.]
MGKIINMIKKDFTVASRDRMMSIIFFYSIIFAFVIRMFVPTVEGAQVKFAIHEGVGDEIIMQIEEFGEVIVLDNVEDTYERVQRVDSVAGLVMDGGKLQLVFEGNEPEGFIETNKIIINEITSPAIPISIDYKATEEKGSILMDLLTVVLVAIATYMGGLVSGFTIVDDKETKTIRAIVVSPLNVYQYIISKYASALFVGLFGTLGATVILMGGSVNYVEVMLIMFFSSTMVVATGVFIGTYAENQMGSLVLQKVTGWMYMIVPILSFFVGERWQVVLYPLPTYWQTMMIRNVYMAGEQKFDFWFSGAMTFVSGAILLMLILRSFRRKVRI